VWIDNGANISEDMAAQVQNKACKMQTVFVKHATESFFDRQVGFLKDFKGDPGDPRACTPVTALHNITQVKDHVYSRSSAIFPDNTGRVIFAEADRSAESLEVIDLASPTAELSYPWKHGVDIAWGNAIPVRDDDPVSIHIAKYSFDKVREGFQYKAGQKVGITVYSDTGATPKTAGTLDIDQERLDQIYGRRRHTHIYTGKITYVGEQHIEDDVNAFEGCSGAIVFLLNTDQPNDSGVTVKDYGTAIAVLLGVIPTR
jgi:hypothetical protein